MQFMYSIIPLNIIVFVAVSPKKETLNNNENVTLV